MEVLAKTWYRLFRHLSWEPVLSPQVINEEIKAGEGRGVCDGWGLCTFFFFSSTTLAGAKACRWKGIEGDLETESKREQSTKLGLTQGPGPRP